MMEQGLSALCSVDFNWTSPLESIWQTPAYHHPGLHQAAQNVILQALSQIGKRPDAKPLGQVIAGSPGAGKTQLLAHLRASAQEQGAFFILVDMVDIRDFWETTLLGFLDSLQREHQQQRQFDRLLTHLFTRVLPIKPDAAGSASFIRKLPEKHLRDLSQNALRFLARKYTPQTHAHQDVIRALFLLASDDFQLSDIGYTWLQGLEIEPETRTSFGFRQSAGDARTVIRGLSWLMSLAAPTLLAFDQLDAIMAEHSNTGNGRGTPVFRSSSHQRSLAIIEGIAGGLMGLWDMTPRTLMVLSCTDTTWATLEQRSLRSSTARFRRPLLLERIPTPDIAEAIIINRLDAAYQSQGFQPPYPSFPFRPAAFQQARDFFPRDLLQACDRHREKCQQQQQVLETETLGGDTPREAFATTAVPDQLGARFATLRQSADFNVLASPDADDGALLNLLPLICQGLLQEMALPPDIDAIVEHDFNDGSNYPPLHARIRFIHRSEGDRELHFAIRALQKTHATAFQSRLKAAMTASGIDRELPFRQLLILRTTLLPTGPATRRHLNAFVQAGGVLHQPREDELRSLWAIAELLRERPSGLTNWLRQTRPLTQLPLVRKWRLQPILSDLFKLSVGAHNASGPEAPAPDTLAEPTVVSGPRPVTEIFGIQPDNLETLEATPTDPDSKPPTAPSPTSPAAPSPASLAAPSPNSPAAPSPAYPASETGHGYDGAVATSAPPVTGVTSVHSDPSTELGNVARAGTRSGVGTGMAAGHPELNGTSSPAGRTTTLWPSPPNQTWGNNREALPLGHHLVGQQETEIVALPLAILPRHCVVLAGAGSGKTVLVRRIVELAALRGIPAIVLDAANDLARLGQSWPEAPQNWSTLDAALAQRYFRNTETVIWTPGLQGGNPLYLDPLPDFRAVADSPDERQQALTLALGSLVRVLGSGQSARAKSKQGVLASALDYFSRRAATGLDAFIQFLADLPAAAGGNISNANTLAAEIADQLRAERATNILWRQQGQPLDPRNLFGLERDGPTRISVINLAGLPDLENQRQFVAQLGMTLFTWIRKHPAPPTRPLRGLLVIDEAKDFVPSGAQVSSKDTLLRLAAQARKYGLGLILASQAPRSIDHNVIANCTTHLYGRANSPTAISTVKELMRDKGGQATDIGVLGTGEFYIHSEGFPAPLKTRVPLCLSHHAPTPPTEPEIQTWATQSRRLLTNSAE